ncbi:MAG: PIN domain-containing protein [Clostridiales bacterium]|nr:PIN domain-containing protein [Clostridiales bacterium]
MNENKTFVDTNVIVYSYDSTAGEKHSKAKKIMTDLWRSGGGLVSTQVLQELYVTLTRKIPRPLKSAEAGEIIEDMLTWDIVVNDGESILQAISLETREKVSFWDALVVVAAMRGGAETLLSEDLPAGRTLEGVRVLNPFLSSE